MCVSLSLSVTNNTVGVDEVKIGIRVWSNIINVVCKEVMLKGLFTYGGKEKVKKKTYVCM